MSRKAVALVYRAGLAGRTIKVANLLELVPTPTAAPMTTLSASAKLSDAVWVTSF